MGVRETSDLYLNRNQVAVCSGFGALIFGLCEFDDLSLALDNDETIEIVDPEPGDWFIDLFGFDAYSGVTLTTATLVDGQPVPPGGVPGTPSGPSFVIETAAGSDPVRDGGQATSGVLYFPDSVALDGAGNLYISDSIHFRVRKVSADGVISTFAGTGISGFSSDGGSATVAQLASPRGLAVDSAGNVYIADIGNHNVRRVSADGVITTYAGLPPFRGFRGDGGPATNALLSTPIDVAVDGAGNVYIADVNNHRVRMVDAQGLITTIAGTGVRGFSGDGGPATQAQLGLPDGVAIDGAGNIYIAGNSNHRVRMVNPAGIISTVAGNGQAAFGGDGGPATSASLFSPRRLTLDADENLYIADAGNHRVRKVNPEGVITTVAGDGVSDFGGDGGPATAAQLSFLTDVAVDDTGEFYIADSANHRVRKVTPEGVISTAVGTSHYAGDGGPATQALLFSPFNMEPDGDGNIYISDTDNNVVRKATADGIISTVAGVGVFGFSGDGGPAQSASLARPMGLVLDSAGNLYIADDRNHRVRRVTPDGVIDTVAGTGAFGFSGDSGPATEARFDDPIGLALDQDNNLYISDRDNHRVRRVTPDGTITTVAGSGPAGFDNGAFAGDGGPAVEARLNRPEGLAFDGNGNLYIADTRNQRVRKVTPGGVIDTVAGTGVIGSSGDWGSATAARLSFPADVAVDGEDNLYIADDGNHSIRRVDREGVITTVAGNATRGFSGDGGLATEAQLSGPDGVAVDPAGYVYIADQANDRIRVLKPVAVPAIFEGGVALATQTPLITSISPNAIITVAGAGFALPGTLVVNPELDAEGRVSTNLADTCLEINGERSPMFAVLDRQINAQASGNLTPGNADVVVISGCDTGQEFRSEAMNAVVEDVSPGFFNFVNNLDGVNPLAALHGGGPGLVGEPGLIPGAEFTEAEPDEFVSFFGTGFGETDPPLAAGEIPIQVLPESNGQAPLVNEVTFTIDGVPVPPEDLFYAGAAPCCAGLQQFVVKIHSNARDGNLPVRATVNGVLTPEGPFVTVKRR